jgi:hypothetical protein
MGPPFWRYPWIPIAMILSTALGVSIVMAFLKKGKDPMIEE